MFIIGLTGRAGSGKDTAGQVLVRQLGFKRYAFADPIKKALNAMFGWHMRMWEDREWKEANLPGRTYSPRYLAQTLGTEWGRAIDTEFWVHVTESLIHRDAPSRVVITDVRFDNEAKWIQRQGGLVIEILRPDAAPVNQHASELGVHPNLIDFTIVNDGRLSDFESQVLLEITDKLRMAA